MDLTRKLINQKILNHKSFTEKEIKEEVESKGEKFIVSSIVTGEQYIQNLVEAEIIIYDPKIQKYKRKMQRHRKHAFRDQNHSLKDY